MQPWNDRQQLLEVIGVSDEAPDVMTFTFRSDNQTLVPLPAGPVRDAGAAASGRSR